MNTIIKEGKNKEELISSILEEFKCAKDEIILKESTKKGGLFKGELTVIEAIKVSDIADYIKSLLKDILTQMGFEITFESRINQSQITIKMFSDKNYILIGKNGQTLTALQTIIRQAIFNKIGMYPYIILDVENYKDKQVMHLERLVKNVAREVATTGIEIKLDSMNSYERRIVHSVLSENKKVYTESVGEEPNRCIVIKPKK